MICVDASVAAKWLLEEERSELAEALLRDVTSRREQVIAPPLIYSEFTNILRQRMRRTGMTLDVAERLLDGFLDLPVVILSVGRNDVHTLHRRALQLADLFSLPAAYDAHYLGLAELHRCPLWTDDRRLLRSVAGSSIDARWIGHYQPA